jgi:hypothetical protein
VRPRANGQESKCRVKGHSWGPAEVMFVTMGKKQKTWCILGWSHDLEVCLLHTTPLTTCQDTMAMSCCMLSRDAALSCSTEVREVTWCVFTMRGGGLCGAYSVLKDRAAHWSLTNTEEKQCWVLDVPVHLVLSTWARNKPVLFSILLPSAFLWCYKEHMVWFKKSSLEIFAF